MSVEQITEDIEQIREELHAAKYAIAFTGAGMSTESGLPDYRGATGLWNNKRFEELAHIKNFEREPEEFWKFYKHRIDGLKGIEPNAAHEALHKLHEDGVIKAIITQNVDGLHMTWDDPVVELHGSLRIATCLRCFKDYNSDELQWPVPTCECGEVLKPGVTLFGEAMPRAALDYAMHLAGKADYMLVLGSSLRVIPAAYLPEMVLDMGGKLGIINQGGTPFDHKLYVTKVDAKLGATMKLIA